MVGIPYSALMSLRQRKLMGQAVGWLTIQDRPLKVSNSTKDVNTSLAARNIGCSQPVLEIDGLPGPDTL